MTADEFRALALGLSGVVEMSHMNHPDFRVGNKIFATLSYPGPEWGMVNLPVEEQTRLGKEEPKVFVPVKGAWGRAGCANVYLPLARKESVRLALRAAWTKRLAKETSAGAKNSNGPKPARPARKREPRRSR